MEGAQRDVKLVPSQGGRRLFIWAPKICPLGKSLSSWTCLEMLDELTRWTSVHVQPSLNLHPTGHLQGNDSRWSSGQGNSHLNLHLAVFEVTFERASEAIRRWNQGLKTMARKIRQTLEI
jgi:hypothetical protein